ncbi:MAG: hypothetical protein JNL57_12240 [Bacteroidetes bacterium]|nr:hypothetical protein [Bacteroidota bacterium]
MNENAVTWPQMQLHQQSGQPIWVRYLGRNCQVLQITEPIVEVNQEEGYIRFAGGLSVLFSSVVSAVRL